MTLSASQTSALTHVRDYARARAVEAKHQIEHVLQMSNVSAERLEEALASLKSHARVALHFHPDRPGPHERTVAQELLTDGIYRSQFETGISNGGVSAHPGGDRQRWENSIFGGAYDRAGNTPAERPKYGALDLMLHSDGPAPRFGSCYFLLDPKVSHRSTFTYLDSHEDPVEKGTYEAFDDIAAALLRDTFTNDFAIGERDLSPNRLIDHLATKLEFSGPKPSTKPPSRNLNHYIEAQVHGEISLREDAEALIADPSFAGTPTGHDLEALCERYAIQLSWHTGFSLALIDVPSDFRGPTMPSLARRISGGPYFDVHTIGRAVAELRRDANQFSDRGTPEQVLQELKLLWHVLVRHGRPFQESQSH